MDDDDENHKPTGTLQVWEAEVAQKVEKAKRGRPRSAKPKDPTAALRAARKRALADGATEIRAFITKEMRGALAEEGFLSGPPTNKNLELANDRALLALVSGELSTDPLIGRRRFAEAEIRAKRDNDERLKHILGDEPAEPTSGVGDNIKIIDDKPEDAPSDPVGLDDPEDDCGDEPVEMTCHDPNNSLED
jgi:hypothetical protein